MDIALIINISNGKSFSVAYMELDNISYYYAGNPIEQTIAINSQEKYYSGDPYLLKQRVDLIKQLAEKKDKVDPTFFSFLIDPIKSVIKGEDYLTNFGDIFFNEKEIEGINHLAKKYKLNHDNFITLSEKMNLEEIIKKETPKYTSNTNKLQ